jgi:hypothetical protein
MKSTTKIKQFFMLQTEPTVFLNHSKKVLEMEREGGRLRLLDSRELFSELFSVP